MSKNQDFINNKNIDDKITDDGKSVDDENYIIKANMCKKLSKEFGLDEVTFDKPINWDIPSEPGLINSNKIIPDYYKIHNNKTKMFNVDYYEIIKDNIRNYRPLNNYQLEYIKKLSHEHKNELIDIFNDCIISFTYLLDNKNN